MSPVERDLPTLSGVLLVDKPPGPTSHDVVDILRRLSGLDRVGHGGTLDPMASGLLPIFLGDATKMSGFLMAHDKTYDFDLTLGTSTDTHDAEGTVTSTRPVPVGISPDRIEEVLSKFRGELFQVPPMYSALKKGGVPLYRLARKGVSVERDPRRVTLHSLQATGFDGRVLGLSAHCSKGTYVRVLGHEIGEALGCGGHISRLRRIALGTFRIRDAVSLAALQASFDRTRLGEALLPPGAVFAHLPGLRLLSRVQSRLLKGGTIPGTWVFRREGLFHAKDTIRILSQSGNLLGLAHALFDAEDGRDVPVGIPVAMVDLLFRPDSFGMDGRTVERVEEGP